MAGQSLKFPREKVSAIYFAAPAKGAVANPLEDALRVLKGLQSAVNVGVTYGYFATRVTDAKIHLDQMLSGSPDGPAKTSLAEALGFYVYAANAWNATITDDSNSREALGRNPLFDKRESLKGLAASYPGASGRTTGLPIATMSGVNRILNCASERIATAERLIHGK